MATCWDGADFVCIIVLTYYAKQCTYCGGRYPPVPVSAAFSSIWKDERHLHAGRVH